MDRPCQHCTGTGECDQICCTTMGNAVRAGEAIMYVCMVCQGSREDRR